MIFTTKKMFVFYKIHIILCTFYLWKFLNYCYMFWCAEGCWYQHFENVLWLTWIKPSSICLQNLEINY